jgi:peroxiredoxin
MVAVGDPAPDFEVPYATRVAAEEMPWGETFRLSEHVGDGPVVLAFFPGAFSPTCTHEMEELNDRLPAFEAAGATVLGISADLPFALHAFHGELDLGFDLLSDYNRGAARAYDASIDSATGVDDIDSRALYVVDSEGTVVHEWDGDPADEPDYEAVVTAVEGAD